MKKKYKVKTAEGKTTWAVEFIDESKTNSRKGGKMITLEGAWPKKPKQLKKTKMKKRTIRNKLDKVWSKIIRSKNKGRCEVCEKVATNPHHIVGRRNLTLRWDLRNGCNLCPLHHTLGRESAHQDPIWFIQWLMQNRSDDYNYLFEQREKITIHIDYKAKLEELEKEKNE